MIKYGKFKNTLLKVPEESDSLWKNNSYKIYLLYLHQKLTHLFIALLRPNLDRMKHLGKKYLYFFGGEVEKIKNSRKVIVQNCKFGGCKMIHLDSYVKALKLTWVRRIINAANRNEKNIFGINEMSHSFSNTVVN